jgi:hypothetical protein
LLKKPQILICLALLLNNSNNLHGFNLFQRLKCILFILHSAVCSCIYSPQACLPMWIQSEIIEKIFNRLIQTSNVSSFVCEFIKHKTHVSLKKNLENWSLFQKVHATDVYILTIYIQFLTIIVFWFDSPKSKFTAPMRPHVGCCVPYISPYYPRKVMIVKQENFPDQMAWNWFFNEKSNPLMSWLVALWPHFLRHNCFTLLWAVQIWCTMGPHKFWSNYHMSFFSFLVFIRYLACIFRLFEYQIFC